MSGQVPVQCKGQTSTAASRFYGNDKVEYLSLIHKQLNVVL